MSRTVVPELYDFFKERETGLYRKGKSEIVGYVCVDYSDLKAFADIVGPGQFDDGGLEVTMLNGYIAIDINSVIEGYGQGLSDYKNCFNESDWETYKDAISEMEKE